MMIFTKGYAIMGITMATGFLCLQDCTKKGMVLRNFAKSMWDNKQTSLKADETKKTTMTDSIKQKYNNALQTAKQIKNKGDGSYYVGLKKIYQEDANKQLDQKKPIKQKITDKLHNIKEKATQTAEKIKQQGGIKAVVSKKIQGAKQTISEGYTGTKTAISDKYSGAVAGYHKTVDNYNKASEAKSQKLIKKHLMFGGMSLIGSLLMPKTYFMLTAAYFAVYQLYYFAEQVNQSKGYSYFQPMRFTPIWTAFMIGGGALFGVKSFKTVKQFV